MATTLIGDAGSSPEASARLQVHSTTQGTIPYPRMTEAQRDAISSPAEGLGIWNTDTDALNVRANGAWVAIGSSGGSAPADATYITQTASSGLSAEQALSSLATGLMQVTTTTGVISSVTTSAGLAALISDETGSGALVFANTPTLVTPNIGAATGTSVALTNTSAGATTVLGRLTNASSTTATAVELQFNPSSATTRYASIQGIQRDGSNNIELAFLTGAGAVITQKLYIRADGKVGIGTDTPLGWLGIAPEDSATNTVLSGLSVGHNSSGTPAAGFGTDITLRAESSTTTAQAQARLRSYWNVATHASRAAYSIWSAYDTNERDVIGIGANGSAGLIGLFDKATAPVAQSAGWAVTNPSTRKTFDTTTVTLPQLAEVVGTMITYWLSRGDYAA